MELNSQIIKKNGENEFVVLPYTQFLKIQRALEDYEDLLDLRKAKTESVKEPSVPFKVVAQKIRKKISSNSG